MKQFCRPFAIILFLSIILSFIPPIQSHAATYGNLTYQIVDGEVTITSCSYSATGSLSIPAIIDNYPVTKIGASAFSSRKLSSITVPDTVTVIGEYAFFNCSSLTQITLPDSITSIEEGAFYACDGLKNISIPSSVTNIGNSAFSSCTRLGKVTIPEGITSIAPSAFSYCKNLYSVTIPDTVTSIGSGAFGNCSALSNITLPSSVTSIGSSAFSHTSITSFVIPDGVAGIEDHTFSGCKRLTKITIPDSVDHSGWRAFFGCTGLSEIRIPDGVTVIKEGAFYGCTGLRSVTIPNGITSIEDDVFLNCPSLDNITIPNGVTSIGNCAFYKCSSLSNVTIPDSVASIGAGAFYDCSGLTEITIPDKVTSINSDTFYGCTNLANVSIPDSVSYIGERAFDNCGSLIFNVYEQCQYLGNENTPYILLCGTTTKDIETADIYPTAKFIYSSAFYECAKLAVVTIPEDVTQIGDSAFYGCKKLAAVTIPDGVTAIGKLTFSGCESLTEMTIPENVTTIADQAFAGCTELTTVTIPDGVETIGSKAFSDCSNLIHVRIPDSITSVGSASLFTDYFASVNHLFSGCTSLQYNVFGKCRYLGNENNPYTMLIGTQSTSITTITVHPDTKIIVPGAFENSRNLKYINFAGHVPIMDAKVANGINATGYYHAGAEGWSEQENLICQYGYGCGGYDPWEDEFGGAMNNFSITFAPKSHILSGYTYDQNHTCTQDGTETAVCLYCGITTTRPAEGTMAHHYESQVVPPDCTHPGFTAYTCTLCGDYRTDNFIDALGHSFTNYISDGNATCYIDGTKTAVCDRCTTTNTVADVDSRGHRYENGKCHCGQIAPNGDVNGDSKLNMADVAKVFAHVRGKNILTDETALHNADIHNDGKINIADVARVFAYARDKNRLV